MLVEGPPGPEGPAVSSSCDPPASILFAEVSYLLTCAFPALAQASFLELGASFQSELPRTPDFFCGDHPQPHTPLPSDRPHLTPSSCVLQGFPGPPGIQGNPGPVGDPGERV